MQKIIKLISLATLCLGGFSSYAGCNHNDFSINLPNGYEMVRANSFELYISNPKSIIVIPGMITKYSVIQDYVFGYVEKPNWREKNSVIDNSDVIDGFFVLDTKTGSRTMGLSEQVFAYDLINERKLPSVPTLEIPQRSEKCD